MGEGGAEPPTKLLKGGLGKISIFKGVLGKSGLTFCKGGGECRFKIKKKLKYEILNFKRSKTKML